jgi:hypothetical protein
MLSKHRLAQTQLVQPDCTTPHQLAQPGPHQPDHYINPRALILGFQPFCSTAAATETALSLSLSHCQDATAGPSLRAPRHWAAGCRSTLLDVVAPALLLIVADPIHTAIPKCVDAGSRQVPHH